MNIRDHEKIVVLRLPNTGLKVSSGIAHGSVLGIVIVFLK